MLAQAWRLGKRNLTPLTAQDLAGNRESRAGYAWMTVK